jgi:hypothetical protein
MAFLEIENAPSSPTLSPRRSDPKLALLFCFSIRKGWSNKAYLPRPGHIPFTAETSEQLLKFRPARRNSSPIDRYRFWHDGRWVFSL